MSQPRFHPLPGDPFRAAAELTSRLRHGGEIAPGLLQIPLAQPPSLRAFSDGNGGVVLLLDAPGHQAHGQRFRLSHRASLETAGRILGILKSMGVGVDMAAMKPLSAEERPYDPSLLRDSDSVELVLLQNDPFVWRPDEGGNVVCFVDAPGHVLHGKTMRFPQRLAGSLAVSIYRIARSESEGNRGTILDAIGNPTP